MEAVRKLEVSLVEQYKKVPNLPESGRKWLADNIWWLVVVGLILSAIGLFAIASFLALAVFGISLGGAVTTGTQYGAVVGAAIGGVLFITTLLSFALYIAEIILMGMAISPLKVHKKKGWDLLFLIAVINVAVSLVTGIISFNIIAVIMSVIWGAIGAYFLFEIRVFFLEKVTAVKKKPAFKTEKA